MEKEQFEIENIKGNQLLVVIVDDDSYVLELFSASLEAQMIQVLPFSDGTFLVETLKRLGARNITPNLILLDIAMEKMSGLDVLKAIKEDPEIEKIPAIMFSNLSSKKKQEEAEKLGAIDYWLKIGMTPNKFAQKVLEFIEKNK